MPVHDWNRVDAWTFHGFHTAWLTHLSETLNDGRLPKGYYALPDQHRGRLIAAVLTLHVSSPARAPLTLAAYVADSPVEVYLEHLTFGRPLREMPLFLTPDYYINLPLEPTYEAAFRGMPEFWRTVLEAPP